MKRTTRSTASRRTATPGSRRTKTAASAAAAAPTGNAPVRIDPDTLATLSEAWSTGIRAALAPVVDKLDTLLERLEALSGDPRESGSQEVAPAARPVASSPTEETRPPAPSPPARRHTSAARGCLVPQCPAPVLAKQLCETHYRIMRRCATQGETFDPNAQQPARVRSARRACEEPGCTEAHYAKGLCRRHYMAQRSRIRTAQRRGVEARTGDPSRSTAPPPLTGAEPRSTVADDTADTEAAPEPRPGNGNRSFPPRNIEELFAEPSAPRAKPGETLPTAEMVSRVVTQYRGGLDRVAEVLGRNKHTLMDLLDQLDLMPFVTKVRAAERQRIESAPLRDRLDDLLFKEKLLEDLGCLKEVDDRTRMEIKSRCAEIARRCETIEEALAQLARSLRLEEAGMKRLIWRYDLRRYLRSLRLKPSAPPARARV